MDIRAISKSNERLTMMARALENLKSSESTQEFRAAWLIFIESANSILNFLKAGCKKSPVCMAWYENEIRFKDSDELLDYVIEARNVEEHGLEITAEHTPQINMYGFRSLKIGESMVDQFGNRFESGVSGELLAAYITHGRPLRNPPVFRKIGGGEVQNRTIAARSMLTDLKKRNRTKLHPPTVHKGIKISDSSPLIVANLTYAYFEDLVKRAAKYIVK
jgi:hypothetical protein